MLFFNAPPNSGSCYGLADGNPRQPHSIDLTTRFQDKTLPINRILVPHFQASGRRAILLAAIQNTSTDRKLDE